MHCIPRETAPGKLNTSESTFRSQGCGLQVAIADQGTEFTGTEFLDYFEDYGVVVHFIDASSPWQNGRTEKAGQAIKEQIAKMCADLVVQDLFELITVVVPEAISALKLHRCGWRLGRVCIGPVLGL